MPRGSAQRPFAFITSNDPALVLGLVRDQVAKVRVELDSGDPIEAIPAAAPPSFPAAKGKFVVIPLPKGSMVSAVTALDAKGGARREGCSDRNRANGTDRSRARDVSLERLLDPYATDVVLRRALVPYEPHREREAPRHLPPVA